MASVYLIRNGESYYKIGYTNRNVMRRLEELQVASPTKLEVVDQYRTDDPVMLETILHRRHSPSRMEGEWFYLSDEEVSLFSDECAKIERNLKYLKENKI